MGNNASSNNRPTSSPSPGPSSGTASPRPPRRDRDGKHPIPHPGHRTAAAPAPAVAPIHAQGSNSNSTSTVSSSLQSQPGLNPSNSAVSATYPSSPPSNSANSSTGTVPIRPTDIPKSRAVPTDIPSGPGSATRTGEPTRPVAVPHSQPAPQTTREALSPYADSVDTSAMMMPRGSMQDMSYLTRPPRLPLPIEEEIHTPGSPIVAPAEGEPIEELQRLGETEGSAEALQRKTSGLSTTDVEEDEADAAELLVDKTRPTVPTRLEWLRGGEKIYVTGTIFQWSRKQRLHPVEGQPGKFATTIPILPGTHHIRFLVDNQMQTSPDLPTTVDFGNNLVNYIEVNPADARAQTVAAEKKEVPPTEQPPEDDAQARKYKPMEPDSAFYSSVPNYLLDFDQNEDTKEYSSSAMALDRLPNPPSLPGFLGKPILNAATLIKDDNSVLNMPNHTVLNHLATSSIKNSTLAVSATTRYKSKYVTTIIYKPTDHHDA